VLTDKIQDEAVGLAGMQPEASPELLKEEDWTVSRSEHEKGIYGGYIDPFIEEVD
jgi:hypothetical protein